MADGPESTMSGPVTVICALQAERQSWARALRGTGAAAGDRAAAGTRTGNIVLRVCGIGQQAAHDSAIAALRDGACTIISWGVAGGLEPSLRPGTVLLPTTVLRAGGTRLPTDAALRDRLARALAPHVAIEAGELLSVDDVLATPRAKADARRTGAVAVDMESAAIGAIAVRAGRPFAVLRVVLDCARDRLPAISGLVGADGRLDPVAVAKALARPRQWAPFCRSARRYGAARSVLSRCAAVLAAGTLSSGGAVP